MLAIHPELQRRYELFVYRMWSEGAEVWVEASGRAYSTQADLFKRWQDGLYDVPSVADPDQRLGECPIEIATWFGPAEAWEVIGSYHMVQGDGYFHALDLGWRGIKDDRVRVLAQQSGLRQTVPREKWHMQFWDTNGVFPVIEIPFVNQSEEDTMLVMHYPTLRENTVATYDFTFLKEHDSIPSKGQRLTSVVCMRQNPNTAQDRDVTVFSNGRPVVYTVPGDGRTIVVPVHESGLCSVESPVPLTCEAREESYYPV